MPGKLYTIFAYVDLDTRHVTRVGVTGVTLCQRVRSDVKSGRAKSTDLVVILETSTDEGEAIEARAEWIKMFKRGTNTVFVAL